MDFHLRLRRRWLFLSLYFIGLLILFSIDSMLFNHSGFVQAIWLSVSKALMLTLSFFLVLKVLDWMTRRELSDREDASQDTTSE